MLISLVSERSSASDGQHPPPVSCLPIRFRLLSEDRRFQMLHLAHRLGMLVESAPDVRRLPQIGHVRRIWIFRDRPSSIRLRVVAVTVARMHSDSSCVRT